MKTPTLLLLSALLLGGCGRHPLDIPDTEWSRLTPAQRDLAFAKDAALEADAARRARPEIAERERYAVLADEARRARVERRRQRRRLGDSLDCALRDGVAKIAGLGWHPLEETGFRIIRGDHQTLRVKALRRDAARPLDLAYSDSGMTLRLCGDATDPTTCTTAAAPWHDLKNGTQWQVIAPDSVAATLRCAFTPGAPVSVMGME